MSPALKLEMRETLRRRAAFLILMNVPARSERRRFRLSLAASVVINIGLLALAGGIDRVRPVPQPSGRPHIRMVAFSPTPLPAPSSRRGEARSTHLTDAERATKHQTMEATKPPQSRRRALQPPVAARKGPVAPRPPQPRLHIVTIEAPSARVVSIPKLPSPLPVEMPPIQAPPNEMPPLQVPSPALPPHSSPLAPVVPAKAAPPTPPAATLATEASRGTAKSAGAGWTGAAGTETGRKAGGPFGIGDGLAASNIPRHIVYVLDISGSMGSRIQRADDELEQALQGLHANETFNIVAFSGGSLLFDPDMADVTPGSLQKASGFLRGLEIGGETNLGDAVARALMLRDVNEVVILTDGVPTVGETDFHALARTVRRLNLRRARISTIGLVGRNADGTDNSFEAASLLQELARDSNGSSELVPLGVATR